MTNFSTWTTLESLGAAKLKDAKDCSVRTLLGSYLFGCSSVYPGAGEA